MEKLGQGNKICLIAKIKGLSEESKRANKKFNIYIKNYISNSIRHHLLAYAILKNSNYNSLERKHRDNNKPNSKLILEIINSNLYEFQRSQLPSRLT